MANIVVMDIGKTNAKLSIVEASTGTLIDSESTESGSLDVAPYLQLDTEHVWHWYLSALRRALNNTTIDTLCVTAHGATAALVDTESLVLPIIDYECAEPDELTQEYDQRCDSFTETYSPKLPHGLNIGRQLFWQRARFPEEFGRTRHLLPYAQYWTWRLTGKPAGEVSSLGSHTDLWNPVDKTFSSFARREAFDQLIPPLMSADAVLGTPSPEVSSLTGLNTNCKILVGIHDSNASLLPYLKTRTTNFTVMSTGTWVIIFAVGAPLEQMDPHRDCAANVNIYSEPVACARFMGGREFAAVATDPATDKITEGSVDHLITVMDDDVFALPAFAFEGGPYPGMHGQIITSRALTPPERYALASLYCALVSDVALNLCGAQGDIIVEGAYAKNPLLLQCLQALRQPSGTGQDTQQQVLGSTDNTGTTLGAAMLATTNVPPPQLLPPTPLPSNIVVKILRYRTRWNQRVTDFQQDGMTTLSAPAAPSEAR